MSEARKADEQKARWDLMPWPALEEVIKVLTDGADRYGDHNWFAGEGLKYSRLFAAVHRHLNDWWNGEELSPDHQLHHLAHAAAGCLALLAYRKYAYTSNDDRPHFERPRSYTETAANSSDTVGSEGPVTKMYHPYGPGMSQPDPTNYFRGRAA